jgi:four helix bundle protein
LAKIERFEEIKAWQLAKNLVVEIYRRTDDGRFQKDLGLREQVRRAAVSMMSNIARGI